MKRFLMICLLAAAALCCTTGCNLGNYSRTTGLQDEAYVSLVGPRSGKALVTIDDGAPFEMEVVKSKKAYNYADKHKAAVGVGRHRVRVEYGGRVVFDREVFLSSREVKRIEL